MRYFFCFQEQGNSATGWGSAKSLRDVPVLYPRRGHQGEELCPRMVSVYITMKTVGDFNVVFVSVAVGNGVVVVCRC